MRDMSMSPSRGRAPSPRRSQDVLASRNSSRRRPLHERSDSQTNERRLPEPSDFKNIYYSRDDPDDDIYDRNPFPVLPSQILRPSGGFPIFEDRTASSSERDTIVSLPTAEIAVRTRSQKGKARRRPSPERTSELSVSGAHQHQTSAAQPASNRSSLNSPSLVSLRRQQLEALDSAVRRAEKIRAEQLASRASMRPLPPSSAHETAEARDRAFLAKYQSLVLNRFTPGDLLGRRRQEERQGRPRSRSSVHTSSRPNSQHSMRQSEDRPRSASQPAPVPAEGDLSAMLSEGLELQYARIQQPSMTSLRSESSSVRRAYPAPLRLKRKRAEDHLSRLASSQPAPRGSRTRSTRPSSRSNFQVRPDSPENDDDDDDDGNDRSHQRTEGQAEQDATTFSVEFADDPDMDLTLTIPQRAHLASSTAYTDELDDTVGELHAPGLRLQRSAFFSDRSSATSRPGSIQSIGSQASANSLATHRQFLTHFLNDSKTTWAQPYYGGKTGLYLEAPSVVNLSPAVAQRPATPVTQIEQTPTSWETLSGMSSSSPNSSEYASQIYVPRIRAMAGADSTRSVAGDDADTAHSFSFATGDTPSLHQAAESTLQSARRLDNTNAAIVATDHTSATVSTIDHPHRPRSEGQRSPLQFDPFLLPGTPRLWQDKNLGFSIYSLRSPSLDRYERPWGPVNRQWWLLLIGFCMPLAWMLAACLPIPAQPMWRRESNASHTHDPEQAVLDFWNAAELKRYQKARRWRVYNRFMSLLGLCIIAVVIAFAIIGVRG